MKICCVHHVRVLSLFDRSGDAQVWLQLNVFFSGYICYRVRAPITYTYLLFETKISGGSISQNSFLIFQVLSVVLTKIMGFFSIAVNEFQYISNKE